MTVMKMAAPGARIIHGTLCRRLRPSLIILPHSAMGGLTPRPKKDKAASSIIIVPISSTAVTSTGPAIFGKICRITNYRSELPDSLAAMI